MYLKLATRNGAAIGSDTTFDILSVVIRLGEGDKPATERDLQFLGISKDELARLTSLMQDMRKKKIETIEFRGCNLGKNPASVKRFKEFFGAKLFGAPDLYSFFGTSTVNIGQKYRAKISRREQKASTKG